MVKAVALSVGSRYAFSSRSTISFISLVAIGGLALSVAVLVVVVSVINGFERELEERVFGVLPHLSLAGREPIEPRAADLDALEGVAGIEGVTPFVQGAGLGAVADRVSGVLITGINPQSYQQVSSLGEFVQGRLPDAARGYEVVLGAQVARQLQVMVGDKVTLVLPSATVTPAGLFPRQKRFTVSGVLQSRSEIDARGAYVHIGDAQRLFRLGGRIHGYQVRLNDLFAATEVGSAGIAMLGADRFFARSWMRTHGNLYRAIGVMKSTMFVLLSFLVAVAAFNLVSTLVMVVDQRSGDVAILRTLGSDTGTLVGAFVVLGVLLGGLGIALGVGVGALFALGLPGAYQWLAGVLETDL
ncbi:MAG: ABC transporter permease, partial [Gammaproteobacteria bacterium]|nr:ABC transporter permease [Gammaproteobacteria bacterium]